MFAAVSSFIPLSRRVFHPRRSPPSQNGKMVLCRASLPYRQNTTPTVVFKSVLSGPAQLGIAEKHRTKNQPRFVLFEVWYVLRELTNWIVSWNINRMQNLLLLFGTLYHFSVHIHSCTTTSQSAPAKMASMAGKAELAGLKCDRTSLLSHAPLPTSFPRESKWRTLNLRLADTAEAVIEFIDTLVVMPADHSVYADAAVLLWSDCVQRWFDTLLPRGFVRFV